MIFIRRSHGSFLAVRMMFDRKEGVTGLGISFRALGLLLCLLCGAGVAQAQVSLPHGTYQLQANDIGVESVAGPISLVREWDGREWHFNPHWESLSASFIKPLADRNCAVWVQDGWDPSTTGGSTGPWTVPAFRYQSFNQSSDLLPALQAQQPQTISVSSCNTGGTLNLQGLRRRTEFYAGQGTVYAFNNRFTVTRQSVRRLPAGSADVNAVIQVTGFRWQDRAGGWMDYDERGQLVAYGDRNNNTVWLQRNANGVLERVLDHQGRPALAFIYSNDRLVEVRDFPDTDNPADQAVRSVKYTYDTYQRLTQVTDIRGHITRYAYDSKNRLITVTTPDNKTIGLVYEASRVAKYTAEDGTVVEYEFDQDDSKRVLYSKYKYPSTDAGRRTELYTHDLTGQLVAKVVNGLSVFSKKYDTATRTETTINERGVETRVTRNEFDLITKVTYPDGATVARRYDTRTLNVLEATDELGVRTLYGYDEAGNLRQVTEAVGQPEQRITDYERDSQGHISRRIERGQTVTLPDGQSVAVTDRITRYSYNTRGQLTELRDPDNALHQYQYDRTGNLVVYTGPGGQHWQYRYDASGNLLESINPLAESSTYQYDPLNRQTRLTDAEAHSTTSVYDAAGRLTQVTNALSQTREWRYNAVSALTAVIDTAGQTALQLRYDGIGRLVEALDGNNDRIQFDYGISATALPEAVTYPRFVRSLSYDSRNRLTQAREAALSGEVVAGGSSSRFTSYRYDARGQLLEQTDPANQKTRYQYDALGRMIQVTNALNQTTRYVYDPFDNLLAVQDAKGSLTQYRYDGQNRRVQEILPQGEVIHYRHDSTGRLIEVEHPAGNKQQYDYDTADRLQTERHVTAAGQVTRTVQFRRNRVGVLAGYTDTNSTHAAAFTQDASYELDALYRPLRDTVLYGSQRYEFQRSYGANGRVASLSYPNGDTLAYSYDPARLFSSARLVPANGQGEQVMSVTARQNGLPTQVQLPGGSQQTFNYDAFQRLAQHQLTAGNATQALDRRYTYDAADTIRDLEQQSASGTDRVQYNYDAVYRLIGADFSDTRAPARHDESFSYDAVGNRESDSRITGAWQYNDNHQLLESPYARYRYDANGALIERTPLQASPLEGLDVEAGEQQQYAYDAEGRLAEVRNHQQQVIARYQYDPFGRRIAKVLYRKDGQALSAPQLTHYLYQPEGLVAEADGTTGALTVSYGYAAHTPYQTAPLFRQENQQTHWYVLDHLGTPVGLVDGAGQWVWEGKAQSFGETQVVAGNAINNALRFPGQYADPETGFNQNYFRDYDATAGRYVQRDPIGLQGGINTYAYVEGNPLAFFDVFGLDKTYWHPGDHGRNYPFDGPRNGNWGGKNWSGGKNPRQNGGRPGTAPPTDSADQCYKDHDSCYDSCRKQFSQIGEQGSCFAKCDKKLVDDLEALPNNSRDWPKRPRSGTENDSEDFLDDAIDWFDREPPFGRPPRNRKPGDKK